MTDEPIPCDYCFMEIEQKDPGWGWYYDEWGRVYFHSECFQEAEFVDLV
jgi:hypothetical protein